MFIEIENDEPEEALMIAIEHLLKLNPQAQLIIPQKYFNFKMTMALMKVYKEGSLSLENITFKRLPHDKENPFNESNPWIYFIDTIKILEKKDPDPSEENLKHYEIYLGNCFDYEEDYKQVFNLLKEIPDSIRAKIYYAEVLATPPISNQRFKRMVRELFPNILQFNNEFVTK